MKRCGKFSQAEAALKRSVGMLEKLAADHPQDAEISSSLGHSYRQMADALLLQGDNQSALEWSGRAIVLYRSLANRDPRNLHTSRTWLSRSLATRAETLMRLGRHEGAAADFEEIVELTRDIKAGELFRAFHALSKARLGDLSALARLGNEVRETLKVGAGNEVKSPYVYYMLYYDAACIHVALANLVPPGSGKTAGRPAAARPTRP